ncbi:MAG TPA: hypothetical protein VFA52_01890 [Candidatus Paceibacterota bacterium]|nr:hypothetical protein [Candidatus Paceibacterota bacterium]
MFDSKNLHHAYLIEGDRQVVLEEVKDFLEKELDFSLQGNPDFYLAEHDKFGVDEARELVGRQSQKSFGNDRKIFVIAVNSITREAQNSLLKIFEEPTTGTHFFLIVPSVERLLPTLQSRAVIIKMGQGAAGEAGRAAAFLKASPSKRLDIVKGMIEDLKDEKISKTDLLFFLNEIEKIKSAAISPKISEVDRQSLEELIKMRSFLQDQSSSAKLILEYLALTLV